MPHATRKKTLPTDGRHVMENGEIHWYLDGLQHRDGGPALQSACGRGEIWMQHGVYHRENGPAIDNLTMRVYYRHGVLFRNNGPCGEYRQPNGTIELQWAFNGEVMPFDRWIQENNTLTDEQRVILKLQHG